MRRYFTVVASAIATAWLPAVATHAADATPRAQLEVAGSPLPQPQAAAVRPVSPAAIRPVQRPAGLVAPVTIPGSRASVIRLGPVNGEAVSFFPPEDNLYGLSGTAARETGLRLSPPPGAPKPGWELSGRVGPLRWLSPLDGEGETRLRLGGRAPGQPRMPGMGLINVGIHYNFE